MYNSIDIKEIDHITNPSIIDLRDKYEYLLGHIKSAINIPANYLFVNPDNYLVKEKSYYLYCDYGSMSRKLCLELNKLGFNMIDLIGGYEKYIE